MGKSVGWAPPQQPRKATCDLSADASHQALARASHFTAAAMRARITGPPSRIRRTRHGERRMNSAPAICVCSVYYQPNSSRRGGPLSRPPAGCALGSVGNPFDRVWPPTTSGDLQPIFSCVDSRGTHPLCVYVREYGTHTHVVCTWVCVG